MNITDSKKTKVNEMNAALKANSDVLKAFSKNVPMVAIAENAIYQKMILQLKYELFIELQRAKELVKPKYPKWEIFKMMCSHPLNFYYGFMALLGMRISAIKKKVKMWLRTLN